MMHSLSQEYPFFQVCRATCISAKIIVSAARRASSASKTGLNLLLRGTQRGSEKTIYEVQRLSS